MFKLAEVSDMQNITDLRVLGMTFEDKAMAKIQSKAYCAERKFKCWFLYKRVNT